MILAASVSHGWHTVVNLRSSRPDTTLPITVRVWDNICMRRLEITLPSPAENLALDEALLDWAEAEKPDWEFLRVWESPQPMVVVGRSTRLHLEVEMEACRARAIPILRRSSGGAAIVAGPGCLMYAVVLSYALRPELKDIGRAHTFVLQRMAANLQPLVASFGTISFEGTSDLVFDDMRMPSQPRKFSGNSLRAKRTHLLYHGTLLYNSDLTLIETCLRMPPRQPEYRQQRPHRSFVMNLPAECQALVDAVDRAWPTSQNVHDWPRQRVAALVNERFSQHGWNLEFE
jgi:lipoate-protein ligase A